MPIIVAEVEEFPAEFRGHGFVVRGHLRKAGIPLVSRRDRTTGYEILDPAQSEEGEVRIIWRSYEGDTESVKEQSEKLREIMNVLAEFYWVRLDLPSSYRSVNRPTLRVLFDLRWLSKR